MKLVSTRDPDLTPWTFEDALFQGLAPDGGLFTPAELEPLPPPLLARLKGRSIGDVAAAVGEHLLGPELGGGRAAALARTGVGFPFPVHRLRTGEHVLDLFHGPTMAFKDVGARFMSQAMAELRSTGGQQRTILVATSGDTGGAVAQAFRGRQGVRVVILFPRGKVSPRQQAQLSVPDDAVVAVAVDGGFDDCQQLVKAAFADPELRGRHGLTSANSINVGRLIPQIFYFVYGALALARPGQELLVSVPSGNLGNLTAGLLARVLGAPIDGFVAATNINRTLPDFLETGRNEPRPTLATLSNAMDVGDPSNLERIIHICRGEVDEIRRVVSASAWTDDDTRRCIRETYRQSGIVLDPHTAVGLLALRKALARRPGARGLLLATAHPAKFAETVEPLVGKELPVPSRLQEALAQAGHVLVIPPVSSALADVLEARA